MTKAKAAAVMPRRIATPSRNTSANSMGIVISASAGSTLPKGIGSTMLTAVSPTVAAIDEHLPALERDR